MEGIEIKSKTEQAKLKVPYIAKRYPDLITAIQGLPDELPV